jgi:hypothetical protein
MDLHRIIATTLELPNLSRLFEGNQWARLVYAKEPSV